MGPAESGLQGLAQQRQLAVGCVWDEAPGVSDHVWLAVRRSASLQPCDLASLHAHSCLVTPGWSGCSPAGAPLPTLSAAQASPGQPSRPLPVCLQFPQASLAGRGEAGLHLRATTPGAESMRSGETRGRRTS